MLIYYERKPDGGHELLDAIEEMKKARLTEKAKQLSKDDYKNLKGFLKQVDSGTLSCVKDLNDYAYERVKQLVAVYEDINQLAEAV